VVPAQAGDSSGMKNGVMECNESLVARTGAKKGV